MSMTWKKPPEPKAMRSQSTVKYSVLNCCVPVGSE